jgi:hypothetical protein
MAPFVMSNVQLLGPAITVLEKKNSYFNGMQMNILQKLTMKYRPAGIRNMRCSLAIEGSICMVQVLDTGLITMECTA